MAGLFWTLMETFFSIQTAKPKLTNCVLNLMLLLIWLTDLAMTTVAKNIDLNHADSKHAQAATKDK